jgi:hypothetical protein
VTFNDLIEALEDAIRANGSLRHQEIRVGSADFFTDIVGFTFTDGYSTIDIEDGPECAECSWVGLDDMPTATTKEKTS